MSLSSFFKKVTKEEYQKDMVDRMGHSVVMTEAIVHTPSPSAQAKHSAKEKGPDLMEKFRPDFWFQKQLLAYNSLH